MLNLYVIHRNDDKYDEHRAMAVVAQSEAQARELAAKGCHTEGPDEWLNPEKSSCETVNMGGEPRVVLVDYHDP